MTKILNCTCLNILSSLVIDLKTKDFKDFKISIKGCKYNTMKRITSRSSHQEVFLEKSVLKICSKFTGEHPCQIVISIKLLRNFIEITLQHGCSPVNLLHIFRTAFIKNTSGRLLLNFRNSFQQRA